MELKDTVQLMQSDDYKDRFRAEYQQLAIRYKKLKKMVDNWDNLNSIPICPKSTYNMQLRAMSDYITVLAVRIQLLILLILLILIIFRLRNIIINLRV